MVYLRVIEVRSVLFPVFECQGSLKMPILNSSKTSPIFVVDEIAGTRRVARPFSGTTTNVGACLRKLH